MKKIILSYTLLIAILFAACRKDDNPKIPDLERVPVPSLSLDASSDVLINPGDPESFHGKVIVDLFFKTDIPPKKMDVVIIKNGDPASVKTLKADVTSFPITIDITGVQLATLFGSEIGDGDIYTIGVDITTQDGKLYQGFPLVGNAYGSGVANQAGGVQTTVEFLKPCTFVASEYDGDFTVVSDEWADYGAGDVIPVTKIDDTHISFEYNVDPGSALPIIMQIDPSTNGITVVKQKYGTYAGGDIQIYAETPDASSSVNPCDLSITLKLQHTDSDGGNYGIATIKLKKKQ
jgi:hypothetical protein